MKKLVSKEIVEIIKDEFELETFSSLFDNEPHCHDLRDNSAGKNAQKSGERFENIFECVLKYMRANDNCAIEWRKNPKYNCHFGLPRVGDFLLYSNNRQVHIECKQLGNSESHFDKLSHCFLNVINGNIEQKEFWLVYDFNRGGTEGTYNKISHLVNRCKEIKKQVALQGITFELILIDDLPEHVRNICMN